MSSLQRQVASWHLNLFLFLGQTEEEAEGSEAAVEKGVRKAWVHQKLNTFYLKGMGRCYGFEHHRLYEGLCCSCREISCGRVAGGKGESTHCHRAVAVPSQPT